MSMLESLRRGRSTLPPRIVVYGEHGLGKSTFAAGAPDPVFLPTEDGLGHLDVVAFPLLKTYEEVIAAIGELYSGDHAFRTVVVDSLDWLEALIHQTVAREHGGKSIEDLGYGKGYVHAADRIREVLGGLNALRTERGMAVVLTAHCQVKRYDDPMTDPYDRMQLKLHAKTAAIVQEWADVVGYAAQEIAVKKTDVGFQKSTARAIQVGGRVLHVERSPAFDAKNRYGLPSPLPLTWSAFVEAMASTSNPNQEP